MKEIKKQQGRDLMPLCSLKVSELHILLIMLLLKIEVPLKKLNGKQEKLLLRKMLKHTKLKLKN